MSGTKTVLADTNILVYIHEGREEVIQYMDNFIMVSVITEMELLGIKGISEKAKKERRNILNDCIILSLDDSIKEIVIEIKEKVKLKIPDAIIAATAIKHNLPLLTADKEFKKIPGLISIIMEL